jgi:hypothetical protein
MTPERSGPGGAAIVSTSTAAIPPLAADRDQLAALVDALFVHADDGGFKALGRNPRP